MPKPKASQVYKVEVDEDDPSLFLVLPSDKDYEIYIQSIFGSMFIYANDEDHKMFVIKGNGDSVLITFNANPQKDLKTNIEIMALEKDALFYVEYRPKNTQVNFQQVKFGSSTEISFDIVMECATKGCLFDHIIKSGGFIASSPKTTPPKISIFGDFKYFAW